MSQFIKLTRPAEYGYSSRRESRQIIVNVEKTTVIESLESGCYIRFEHADPVIVSETIERIEELIRG